tara:strand:- start:1316 stop:1846 length:531 start_codon:yes stop_codon:yes gene_type:complete
MAYTFTEKTFTTGSTFDSLYEDSLSALEGGTVVFQDSDTAEEKKNTLVKLMCNQNYHNMKNIEVAKDGVVCMWVQGLYANNVYIWQNVLVGKINNSKAWTYTSEFHQANKDWIQSIGGTRFALECIKNSAIDTYFTQATTDGICLGTLSTVDLIDETQDEYITEAAPVMKRMLWEY